MPKQDELGPITTHLNVDSPEYISKQKLKEAKKKKVLDFIEPIDKFQPDYVRVYFILE